MIKKKKIVECTVGALPEKAWGIGGRWHKDFSCKPLSPALTLGSWSPGLRRGRRIQRTKRKGVGYTFSLLWPQGHSQS